MSEAALGAARPAALAVRDLAVDRGGERVLDGVAFEVRQTSLVGLIGPNGAGKTSLLEAVTGLIPAAGQVRLAGRALAPSDRRSALFFLPDAIRPCPDHRAGDVLETFRELFERPTERLRDLVRALDIGPVLGKRARELSKGYAKRWLLAIAMLSRAPLLLLDEPLDGLDLHQTLALRPLLETVRAEGRTLVLSIHELSLAESVCETFLLLSGGRLLAVGEIDALRARAGVASGGLPDVFLALT